jgi:hypothetical protein
MPRQSDAELRQSIRAEVLGEIGDALDNATDFESFQDALSNPDSALPDLENVKSWTAAQINDNWEAVSAAMSGQGRVAPVGVGSGPLTMERVKQMSPAEVNANWAEVQRVMRFTA